MVVERMYGGVIGRHGRNDLCGNDSQAERWRCGGQESAAAMKNFGS